MASIKRNLFYNLLLVLSNIAFPFLVFPYVSRVLGPEGIGEVQFALSFAKYFTLIAAIGIPIYGVREIAKLRQNDLAMVVLIKELIILSLIASVICFTTYAIFILNVNRFKDVGSLCWIAGIQILFSFSSIEWVFYGKEQFKKIAFRSIITRLFSVVLIFYFVRESDDIIAYVTISVVSVVGFQFWNIYDVLKDLDFRLSNINLNNHLKPLSFIFATVICTSIYTAFDTTLLGLMDINEEVGFYTSAIRISKLCIPLVSAVSIVLIPKVVMSFADIKVDDSYLQKSFSFIVDLSVPLMVGIFLLAPECILLLAGKEFSPAILALKVLSPLTLLVGLNNLFGTQVLSSSGNEKLLFYAISIGTLVSLVVSILLIPSMHHLGSAISMLLTELVVTVLCYLWVQQKVPVKFPLLKIVHTILLCSPFFLFISFIRYLNLSLVSTLLFSVSICAAWYAIFQIYFFKNQLWVGFMQKTFQLIGFRKNG